MFRIEPKAYLKIKYGFAPVEERHQTLKHRFGVFLLGKAKREGMILELISQ